MNQADFMKKFTALVAIEPSEKTPKDFLQQAAIKLFDAVEEMPMADLYFAGYMLDEGTYSNLWLSQQENMPAADTLASLWTIQEGGQCQFPTLSPENIAALKGAGILVDAVSAVQAKPVVIRKKPSAPVDPAVLATLAALSDPVVVSNHHTTMPPDTTSASTTDQQPATTTQVESEPVARQKPAATSEVTEEATNALSWLAEQKVFLGISAALFALFFAGQWITWEYGFWVGATSGTWQGFLYASWVCALVFLFAAWLCKLLMIFNLLSEEGYKTGLLLARRCGIVAVVLCGAVGIVSQVVNKVNNAVAEAPQQMPQQSSPQVTLNPQQPPQGQVAIGLPDWWPGDSPVLAYDWSFEPAANIVAMGTFSERGLELFHLRCHQILNAGKKKEDWVYLGVNEMEWGYFRKYIASKYQVPEEEKKIAEKRIFAQSKIQLDDMGNIINYPRNLKEAVAVVFKAKSKAF